VSINSKSNNEGISVIVPTYNYGRFIGQAIESVLGQTLPPLEVIVVDDGSTDDTEEVVSALGPAVRYIKQSNSGVCVARNRGAREAVGKYLALLDADDVWEPTKLEKQFAIFASDSEVGLVHCGMRKFDSVTGETVDYWLDGMDGWVANDLLLWKGSVVNAPGGTAVVSKQAFDRVGGFDTRLKVGEDWDFCYRVARLYKFGFVPEPLVNYRLHDAAAHRNVREMERGMGLFYDKAFADPDPTVQSLRHRALSNYHRILAGSYFVQRDFVRFFSHSIKSIWHRPAALTYFMSFPLRRLSSRQR